MKRERRFAPPRPAQTALDRALLDESRDGRIACAAVFRVAAAQGVPVAEAGRAVQELGIRVAGCQLGCF